MSPGSEDRRTAHIVDVLNTAFSDLMEADPEAFRRRFRRMASDPFAFYRGTACLFYADVAEQDDPWATGEAGRVWIQGDLHAENFGTYMDGRGSLVFDVNDFDEAYIGPFTWDLRRLAASIAVLGWTKALSDADIEEGIRGYLRAYLDQVDYFVRSDRDHEWSIRLDTAEGAIRAALLDAQLATRIELLDDITVVEDYDRRFRKGPGVRTLDTEERTKVEEAYAAYRETIPGSKRFGSISYELKDAVGKTGFGIGSAGLPAYNLLVEGSSQALENDVVLTMKQGNVAAPSRVVHDARAREHFQHHGHRTAVSQRALQAQSDPWLGWTAIDGTGFVVQEVSPYERDLDWDSLVEPHEVKEVLVHLGRATAKVHCVADVDAGDIPLVEGQTEDAIVAAVGDRAEEFVDDIVRFGLEYGARARADHALFVDAFRGGHIEGVGPSAD
ncbi:Uncharacterized conserved protein, DUF2252 family [Actinopolymorpha cephalotaxi]|uniref:Uncharacterized conserved protein, DUF2252 family n=1 Tax=Actinopolymorpha cephalotaxi TaxID=504797 RepID=A0A1I2WVA9_9ACTN|nr:DUF2252 domain-containing protein [Actinopolymorpha cephalotaxi]NYH85146.1 uncharacterized protein (DUF2252 family) [Actinopolymorpha cephalotaxi]SFH05235.1 Uncharacterized conserved protein, DUF2252 family [Actinopolymorpha cephalotaxi]